MTDHHREQARCNLNLPYPPVQPGRDPQTASLLLEDYSGAASELTAVTQYFYASAQMQGRCQAIYKQYAADLESIAIAEMLHLDLLAQAIIAKGGDPRYVTMGGRKPERCWNSGVIAYSKDPACILLESIDAEQGAINQYRRHIRCIEDVSVQALLERIVLDEERHLQLFQQLYRQMMGQ